MSDEIIILPCTGYISITHLAKFFDTNEETIVNGLDNNNIPYIKLSKLRKHWIVDLSLITNNFSVSKV